MTRETRLAAALAAIALVAGLVAAIGPAKGHHSEFTWPPKAPRPSSSGTYAPLPLLNRVPEHLDVVLSCDAKPSPRSTVTMAFATARHPAESGGLEVTLRDGSVRAGVGGNEYVRAPWPAACPFRVAVSDGVLRTSTSTPIRLRTSALDEMPVVTGLFTRLDLANGDPLHVSIRTRDYATSQTARQTFATVLALVVVIVMLVLLGLDGRRPRRLGVRARMQAAWASRDVTDGVVLGALILWWILAPPIVDDGWYWTQHRVFGGIGSITQYYEMWGVNLPLGFWFELLRHPVLSHANDLVFLRLPTLFILVAVWLVCRWAMHVSMPPPAPRAARWMLAGAFLVGSMAWGMTLRYEPITSLLAIVVLAAMMSFARAPRLAPLAVGLPAIALAMTAHPAGVVSTAALLAVAPSVARWLRSGGRELLVRVVSLVVATLAVGLTLFSLDADLATRLRDARVVREFETHSGLWWNEHERYTRIDAGVGTAIRNLSVVVLAFGVIAVLTRARRVDSGVSTLPANALAIALALLVLVPSKWPWHFGALLGVGAVAGACEVARLIREQPSFERLPLRPIAVLVLMPIAAHWVWSASGRWSLFDAGNWDAIFVTETLLITVALVPVVATLDRFLDATAVIGGIGRLRPWAGWAFPTLTFSVICLSMAVLLFATTREPWSLPRHNLAALTGRGGCALTDELPSGDRLRDPNTSVLVTPPVMPYLSCTRSSRIASGTIETPRFVIRHQYDWPLDRFDSPFVAAVDLYGLQELGSGATEVQVKLVGDRIPGFRRLDAVPRVIGVTPSRVASMDVRATSPARQAP